MRNRFLSLVAAGALLCATGAFAQADQSSAPGTQDQSATATTQTAKQKANDTMNSSAASSSQLSAQDKAFMKKAAHGGIAEVQIGQMVADKAQEQQVKDFAQKMVTDHGQANDKLKEIAQKYNVQLPTEPNAKQKAMKERLSKLSGEQLDKAYMNDMVKDHTKDVNEFKQEVSKIQNQDLKDWAQNTLQVIEGHLQMAKSIAPQERKEAQSASSQH